MTYHNNEKHSDPLDQASELEMIRTEDAIRRVQKLNQQKQTPDPDGTYPSPFCIECDDEIPLGRLKVAANNVLCIHCATAAERWKR